mgnify:CR=1 FL=1
MLTLSHITKDYLSGDNTVHALRDVSLSFGKAEFVSILGPSGCGKTTLLNIVGGLDRYTSGELAVNGVPTSSFRDRDWDTYRNHSIGFVFQSYNLITHQTVLSNVELALTLSGVGKAERRSRAAEALRKVGLGDQLHKKPTQMSGGQMQRVAIARALVNDPEILLADEPTGALDSATSVQIMDLLSEIARDRLVIMVTHNPELAERYSTRIIRLLDGKVLSDAPNTPTAGHAADTVSPDPGEKKERFLNPAPADPLREKTGDPGKKSRKNPYGRRTSMSFFTALSLSRNNLMTKLGRTFLVAFAGSIGIIGIALILSLSNGINAYIGKVQEDTLSTYPLTIVSESTDMSSLITALSGSHKSDEDVSGRTRVYANTMMYELLDAMVSTETRSNNLAAFKKYVDDPENGFTEAASAIRYGYGITPQIYSADATRLNPTSMFDAFMPSGDSAAAGAGFAGMSSSSMAMMSSSASLNIWQEMLSNRTLMEEQYDVLAGRFPEEKNEVVLIVDERNEINDMYLYALGLKDQDEIPSILASIMRGEAYEAADVSYSYDELLAMRFSLLLPTDLYQKTASGTWEYRGDNEDYLKMALEDAMEIRVVGILKPAPDAVATSLTGAVAYLPSLTEYVLTSIQNSGIVQEQLADPTVDVLTGLPFDDGVNSILTDDEKAARIVGHLTALSDSEKAAVCTAHMTTLSEDDARAAAAAQVGQLTYDQLCAAMAEKMKAQTGMDDSSVAAYIRSMAEEELRSMAAEAMIPELQAQYTAQAEEKVASLSTAELAGLLDESLAGLSSAEVLSEYGEYMPPVVSDSTYADRLTAFGWADESNPTSVELYADTFENKDTLSALIQKYNDACAAEGRDDDVISYTDYVALIMSSISTIINVISYVLIAFVSISLVVSSIMIGIITYISVLERTKEIGILRAIGASKRDISRVFNAETLIIGFAAGMLGILVTLLLCIPANLIIGHLTDIYTLAALPPLGGVILVAISMLLTLIAGIIPARLAAKKDPVEALRSE